jgi:hypothetical protein
MLIPFIGQTNQQRSLNYDAQRTINLYPVAGEGKSPVALCGTPGLTLFATFPTNENRGSHVALNRAFEVFGNTLYEVYSDGSFVTRGTLNTDTGLLSMEDNGQQLCIVDGPNGYILTLSTNVFQSITDPYFIGASTVTFIDGYFMFSKPDSAIYYISNLYDGLTGDPLDFASAEGSPDGLVGLRNVHQQVWLFGLGSIEIVANTGDATFPFQRIQGAFIEYGCASAGSIANTANTVFWLGQDEYGNGVVWMAEGYQPQRISTFAIEYALRNATAYTYSAGSAGLSNATAYTYSAGSAGLSNATAYTYQEDGHYFYVLNANNMTFVYDIGQNLWHERATFNQGSYSRSLPQTHIFAFGKHIVGDYSNGNLYVQSLNTYSENGNIIRRMRRGQHISEDLNYLYFNSVQIDMETGVGLDGISPDPQIMLRWSDDGGHAWSSEFWKSFGKIGQYLTRALWRRLGRSRDRIFEMVITSTSRVFIIGMHANIERGEN